MGSLERFLILPRGDVKHRGGGGGGDLHHLNYEKDNAIFSSLVLFTFAPVRRAMNKQSAVVPCRVLARWRGVGAAVDQV